MKRSKMFRLVTVCTFVVANTIFANLLMAQPPVRYQIHWITGPAETTHWQLNDLLKLMLLYVFNIIISTIRLVSYFF